MRLIICPAVELIMPTTPTMIPTTNPNTILIMIIMTMVIIYHTTISPQPILEILENISLNLKAALNSPIKAICARAMAIMGKISSKYRRAIIIPITPSTAIRGKTALGSDREEAKFGSDKYGAKEARIANAEMIMIIMAGRKYIKCTRKYFKPFINNSRHSSKSGSSSNSAMEACMILNKYPPAKSPINQAIKLKINLEAS